MILIVFLLLFFNIYSQESQWKIARAYQDSLNDSKKISFYSEDEWKKLSPENQNAIRTVLLFKHAEIRNAPLHKLRLGLFNRFSNYINDLACPKDVQHNDPIHSWFLYTNDEIFKKSHKGLVYYNNVSGSRDFSYEFERAKPFSIKNCHIGPIRDEYNFQGDSLFYSEHPSEKTFFPLDQVHSICPLYNRNITMFSPWMGSLQYGQFYSGLLITMNNGMQLVWNQDKKQVIPVGFCRQQNPEEDSYEYCKRMHEYFYTLIKPSQAFTRLYLKRFLWDTPQKWYWHMQIKGIFSLLATFGIFTCLYASFKSRQLAILEALSIFEKELAEKNIIFPQILREQIRK